MLKSLRVLIPLTRRPYWNRRGENFLLRHRKPCQRKNVTLLQQTQKGWTQEEKKKTFLKVLPIISGMKNVLLSLD